MTGSDLRSESTSLTAVGAWAKQRTGRSLCRVREGDGGGGTGWLGWSIVGSGFALRSPGSFSLGVGGGEETPCNFSPRPFTPPSTPRGSVGVCDVEAPIFLYLT